MTCKGYDPRAVKIGKEVKRLAATIRDDHQRSEFIRDYVRIAQTQLRTGRKESSK